MANIPGVRRFLRLPRTSSAQAREDVEAELRFHFDMRIDELVGHGLEPHQARERAEREFGDMEYTRQYCRKLAQRRERKVRGMDWIKNLCQDLKFGARILSRSKGFTIVVLATIGVGIGANTAIFSVVNAVLLRPFLYEEPERLVTIWESNPPANLPFMVASPPNYADWREQNEVFEDIAAFGPTSYFLTHEEEPISVQGCRVTASLFPLLGVNPVRGRNFLSEEDQPGADRVVILSHNLWSVSMGGDPGILDSEVIISDQPHTVIGIMPPDFDFPPPISLEGPPSPKSELWIPYRRDMKGGSRGAHNMLVIGRLKKNATLEQAQIGMSTLAARLEAEYPDTNEGWNIALVPLDAQVFGDLKTPLFLLLGAVGLVLLIACVNIANLLLARGAGRQREIATRASLGAGRSRLIYQLLSESLLLSLLGGLLGLVLAIAGVEVLTRVAPSTIPRLEQTTIDFTVATFTLVISLLTGVLFGLAPALQVRGINLSDHLREGGVRTSTARGAARFRGTLVVVEIALSLVLLAGAGLMIRSFARLRGVDTGFQSENVLTMRLALRGSRYEDESFVSATYRQLEEEINALPGVVSAGFIYDVPLGADRPGTRFLFEDDPPDLEENRLTNITFVTPGYFRTMSVRLLQGRDFTEGDTPESEPVVVVNSTFVRAFIREQDPLSKRIVGLGEEPTRIAGVVGDVRHDQVAIEATPVIYIAFHQHPGSARMSLAARTTGPPMAALEAVRQRIRSVDPRIPIYEITTLDRLVNNSIAESRFTTLLLGLFSAIALLLATVGIYGLIRYSVSQRIHEIGIRTALGAQRGDIIRMVLRQGMILSLAGVVIGLVVALNMSRIIAEQLYNISATDPLTLLGVSVLLAAAAVTACYLPARRASRIDPVQALREE